MSLNSRIDTIDIISRYGHTVRMKDKINSRTETRPRRQRSTLADLAREIEVDPSTISLALRDSPKVSQAMKEKISALAQRRGYVPNAHARALAGGRSALLGVILPCSALPFYSMMLDLLYEEAAKQSLRLEAQFHQWDPSLEISSIRSMLEHRAKGIIAFSSLEDPLKTLNEEPFVDTGAPICFWGRQPDGTSKLMDYVRGFVTVNVRKGAQMATEHLLALGHRRIALMPCDLRTWLDTEVSRGILDAMKSYSSTQLVPVILPKSFSCKTRGAESTFETGECLAREFLRLSPMPTAVVTTDDTNANVLMSALQSAGMRVPENVSVVCSGNTYFSRYGAVPLSCVSMPLDLIAAKLIALVTGPVVTANQREHIFQPQFIPRASTAAPPVAVRISRRQRQEGSSAHARETV